MSAPHEKRICRGLTAKQLDAVVSDYHIFAIASDIKEWEQLAPSLSLTESNQKEIAQEFDDSYYLQKKEALNRWRSKNGERSTYQALINIFCLQRSVDIAERIASYAGSKQQPRDIQMFQRLNWYLLECYRCLPHPFCLQLPSRLDPPFPKSNECTFFDLVLHKAPLNDPQKQIGGVNSSSRVVNLYTALTKNKQEKRLLVYFEGIAGSGKTTLSWYISREWAEKRLLKQFQLFIHVQMNDPKVQSATSLKDLIPNPDDSKVLQKELAAAIISLKGQGVCFLLDGLDEAPTPLLDLLLVEIIQGKLGRSQLPNLSFVMTSRPDSRVTKRLEPVLRSRIVVAGFNKEAMDQFFDNSLVTTCDKRQKLKEKFAINPRLEGLCSLPINAVIMSFLIHFIEEDVPTTQTGLYKPLIINFLLRHIDSYLPEIEAPCIKDLNSDIPSEISEPFNKVCSLAYSSLLKNKHLFTTKEIGTAANVDDKLGFLQVYPQITKFGRKRYYSFAHLSLQEFLAAVHVSKMTKKEQIDAIKTCLTRNPRSQMIPFYAGLTGLSNDGVLLALSESLPQTVESETIMRQLLEQKGDPQQKALAFLNCLFECQNESLWASSKITDLPINTRIKQGIEDLHKDSNIKPQLQQLRSLLLHSLPLTPLDCLSVGYYISVKSRIPVPIDESHILSFDLVCCSLNHTGIHVLFAEIKKNILQRTTVRVQLIMTANKFNEESMLSLKQLVQGQSNIGGVALCKCLEPSIVNIHFALKCLIEGLSNNSSCDFLDLSANNFDSSHIHHIVLLLRASPQINWLEVKDYDLSRVMPLFSTAIALTNHLHSLDLSYCNISDSNLVLLGKRICEHYCPLHHLCICYNPFTHRGLSNFLELFVNTFSRLGFLGLSLQLNDGQRQTLKKINQFRTQFPFLPLLCPKSIKDTNNYPSSIISMLQLEHLRKLKDSV